MKKIIAVLVLNVLFFNLSAQVLSEWRGFGRTGNYADEKNLLKEWPENGPELLWSLDSLPTSYASVGVTEDAIFLTGLEDTLEYLIKLTLKGEILWKTAYGRGWMNSYSDSRCTPTVWNDGVYVSSGMGDIACINPENGKILWQHKPVDVYESERPRFGLSESLLVDSENVYVTPGGNKTTMVAYNRKTGDLVWESESLEDKVSYASPKMIVHNGIRQIVNTIENYIFGLNPKNGKIVWTYKFGDLVAMKNGRRGRSNNTNTPLFYNGELYVTSGYDHKSVKLKLSDNAGSVEEMWIDSILDVHHGGVVRVGDYIYGSNWQHNRMGNWTCLNWQTGKAMYENEWENKGSIITADNMLYCYEEKRGNIALVKPNPEKFEMISSFKVPFGKGPHWAHPVIKDGKLYIRHAKALMVYDIRKK